MLNKRRLLIVVSAPSGTGKTTVVRGLIDSVKNIKRSISFTTRAKKQGEIDGMDYYFISSKEFGKKIKRKEFVEYANVHGCFYGTSRKFLENTKDIILNIDPQGAFAIKRMFPHSILIFLAPPSFKELKKRLLKRKRDSVEDINLRLENAKREIKCATKYDFLVINDKLKDTVEKLKSIIISERERIKNRR